MDATRLLFGRFPRAVGVTTPEYENMELRQFIVHSWDELQGVINQVSGEKNIYSSISAYQPVRVDDEVKGNAVVADKVSFDFDSTAKDEEDGNDRRWSEPMIPDNASVLDVVQMMRHLPEVRDAVLEDVCYNVRELANACLEQDIPIIGVFSGFGIHVHQLRGVTMSRAGDKMISTVNKFTSEYSLSCADEKASGRPFRIMRVPNVERICHEHQRGTGLFTIPLRPGELAQIEPSELIRWSRRPREGIGSEPHSRPEMKVHEEYLGPGYEEGVGQEKMRPAPDESVAEDFAEVLIKEYVGMPCVYERALGRNPPNDVRVKLGIMLLNAGLSVQEATDLIEKLNWVDFDREITEYQLERLAESGKGDWSCRTMQAKGLCVRADEKEECPTYQYPGGNVPWDQ